MEFKFSKEIYSKVALLKAAYNFTDKAYIHLDATITEYIVTIIMKPGYAMIAEQEFVNELLCQNLRHEIYLQTKTIRELLTARAVASTIIDTQSQPQELLNGSHTEQDVLKDWFDNDTKVQ